MTTTAHPSDHQISPSQLTDKRPLVFAAIGYAFMGKAHSNA